MIAIGLAIIVIYSSEKLILINQFRVVTITSLKF